MKLKIRTLPLQTLGVSLLLTVVGCGIIPSVGPDYEKPPETPVPAEWSAKVNGEQKVSEAEQLATWWKLLADPKLDALIEKILGDE